MIRTHNLLAVALIASLADPDSPAVAARTKYVHQIRRWSGLPEDETPVCGLATHKCFASRTIYADTVTCPDCRAAGVPAKHPPKETHDRI